jgi:hypothetical protein
MSSLWRCTLTGSHQEYRLQKVEQPAHKDAMKILEKIDSAPGFPQIYELCTLFLPCRPHLAFSKFSPLA